MHRVRKQRIIYLVLLSSLSVFLMGNEEGCDQNKDFPQKGQRILPLSTQVGHIDSRPVRLPNGEVLDFEFFVNGIHYYAVSDSKHFIVRHPRTSTVESFSPSETQMFKSVGFKVVNYGTSFLNKAQREVPSCVWEYPQVQLDGHVLGFELQGGIGFTIGFNREVEFIPPGTSASVDFEWMRLDTGLILRDYLRQNPGENLATGEGDAKKRKTKFSFNFGGLIGFRFFNDTPIAKTTRTALDETLLDLIESYKSKIGTDDWNDVWEGAIAKPENPVEGNNDTHVVINVGTASNVRVGDTFNVWNREFVWEDPSRPCASRLKRAFPTTGRFDPIATVEVEWADINYSRAKVVYLSGFENIQDGAMIRVKELKGSGEDSDKESKLD